MQKSLQRLFLKMSENGVTEGFKVLKNIRGGNTVDPEAGNSLCENSNTCSNTNSDCANTGDCTKTTNKSTRGCTNYICFE
jgi:hypothetical protein